MLRGHINKFNRGEICDQALARDDFVKINDSASYLNNYLPIRLGPMMFRPGLGFVGAMNGVSLMAPFVAAIDDTAPLEFSDNTLHIWVDDALVTRTAVTSTITNGALTSDLTGWTDGDGAGSTSVWKTGGYMSLTGAGTTAAVRYQTIASTDTGNEHGIRIVVKQAPVKLQLGTSGNGSDDIYSGTLSPGTHSLVFTPDSNVTITLSNTLRYESLVDSVAFEGAETMSLPTNVTTAMLQSVRNSQSADVVYGSADGIQQFKIERRGVKSWSVVDYVTSDGPFGLLNNTEITMTAAALNGDTTLTASAAYFKSDHVGALFKVGSSGQDVTASVTVEDTGTNSIRVTGVGSTRHVTITRSGTWVGKITLQRSTDDATWNDITTYTTNGSYTYDDNLDNSELYYRLWVKTGDYTSGTIVLDMSYSGGSIDGICRVTGYTSSTVVNVQVLQDFGSTEASRDWYEGSWSDDNGYPSAVELYEGRLWWGGKNKLWGSVSDAYNSFDRTIEGNSASIVKTIGFGPVDAVKWLASSTRLLMGIVSDEIAVRSNSFGEVLTQANANLKSGSNQGASDVAPLKIDNRVYFVQRSGTKLFELTYDLGSDVHTANDLNMLNPCICQEGIKKIAFTRQPETRIFLVMNDGTVRVHLTEPTEEVSAWSRLSTDGTIEDVVVLPSIGEDRVYFVVSRTGGRYLEKMALSSEALGGTISKHYDSFLKFTSPGTTITMAHADGKTVAVWADGQDRGTFTVSSNQITVPTAWTDVVVGIPYVADYSSSKLGGFSLTALGGKGGSVLGIKKRPVNVGLVFKDYWPGSLTIGPSTDLLESMPLIEDGAPVDLTATITDYDEVAFEFNGEDEVDPRIHIRSTGPITLMALLYDIDDTKAGTAPPQQAG